jgi:acetylxylan esterase
MTSRFRHNALAFFPLATVLLAASPCLAAWGPLNKDYGGNLNMKLYTPATPAASPAILVAIHYCSGNANSAENWFSSAADKNGFYVIAPDAGANCFDSSATRAGDRADIVKMVQYVITEKKADKNRVFAAGFSSGGCMTNTLLAIYPDVFAGGSAMPGYPAGVWPAGDHSCTLCTNTAVPNRTAQQWGDLARNAFAYTGTRPCVQEWVGGADEFSFNEYFPAVTSQFTNLLGLDAGSPGTGAPSGWNRTVFKDSAGNVRLETNINPSKAHDLTGSNLFASVVSFLGLDKPTGACGLTTGGGGSGSGGTTGTAGSGGSTAAVGSGAGAGTGGTTAAGGSSTGTAGAATSGGAPTTAGAPGSAGATAASGGAPGSGGSTPGGGTPGAAGAKPSAGTAGSAKSDSDSGCSFSASETASKHSSLIAMLGLTAMCIGAARRRKRTA